MVSQFTTDYEMVIGYPQVKDYLHLREFSGLSPKTESQAKNISTGSWFGAYVIHRQQGTVVGMGRIIGDGGWYFLIVDMAILPEHQRKGLGDAILKRLLEQIESEAPPNPYVALMADAPGQKLYKRNGFIETAPKSIGMVLLAPQENST
jgi:GNAT superfamily N-acetyltransferase